MIRPLKVAFFVWMEMDYSQLDFHFHCPYPGINIIIIY